MGSLAQMNSHINGYMPFNDSNEPTLTAVHAVQDGRDKYPKTLAEGQLTIGKKAQAYSTRYFTGIPTPVQVITDKAHINGTADDYYFTGFVKNPPSDVTSDPFTLSFTGVKSVLNTSASTIRNNDELCWDDDLKLKIVDVGSPQDGGRVIGRALSSARANAHFEILMRV